MVDGGEDMRDGVSLVSPRVDFRVYITAPCARPSELSSKRCQIRCYHEPIEVIGLDSVLG